MTKSKRSFLRWYKTSNFGQKRNLSQIFWYCNSNFSEIWKKKHFLAILKTQNWPNFKLLHKKSQLNRVFNHFSFSILKWDLQHTFWTLCIFGWWQSRVVKAWLSSFCQHYKEEVLRFAGKLHVLQSMYTTTSVFDHAKLELFSRNTIFCTFHFTAQY